MNRLERLFAITEVIRQSGRRPNAWCELRDAGRIFRLDRIQSARLTKRAIKLRDVDEVLGWTPDEVTAP